MNSIGPMNFFCTTDTTDTTIWKPGFKAGSHIIAANVSIAAVNSKSGLTIGTII